VTATVLEDGVRILRPSAEEGRGLVTAGIVSVAHSDSLWSCSSSERERERERVKKTCSDTTADIERRGEL
jgi:hypothetical protein